MVLHKIKKITMLFKQHLKIFCHFLVDSWNGRTVLFVKQTNNEWRHAYCIVIINNTDQGYNRVAYCIRPPHPSGKETSLPVKKPGNLQFAASRNDFQVDETVYENALNYPSSLLFFVR